MKKIAHRSCRNSFESQICLPQFESKSNGSYMFLPLTKLSQNLHSTPYERLTNSLVLPVT